MNFADQILKSSLTENLIILSVICAVLINLFLVYRVMIVRDPLAARLKSVNARRDMLKAGITAPKRRNKAQKQKSIGQMRDLLNHFNILRSREARKSADKLAQAGFRSRDALTIYYFLKIALPIVGGAACVIVLYIFGMFHLSSMMRLVVTISVLIGLTYGPDVFIGNAIKKRQHKLRKALPDAIDLLVICAEAGQSLDGAISRVAHELGSSFPEFAEELSLTSIELGLLPDRRTALENLNRRTDLPGIKAVVNTLQQTEKYGTPLAASLRVLAAEFRNERLMRAEEKAARLPAIMTVPLIIFILPPLFIVLLGPAILRTLDQMHKMGWM